MAFHEPTSDWSSCITHNDRATTRRYIVAKLSRLFDDAPFGMILKRADDFEKHVYSTTPSRQVYVVQVAETLTRVEEMYSTPSNAAIPCFDGSEPSSPVSPAVPSVAHSPVGSYARTLGGGDCHAALCADGGLLKPDWRAQFSAEDRQKICTHVLNKLTDLDGRTSVELRTRRIHAAEARAYSQAASLDQYLNVIAAFLARAEESKEETCMQPRSAPVTSFARTLDAADCRAALRADGGVLRPDWRAQFSAEDRQKICTHVLNKISDLDGRTSVELRTRRIHAAEAHAYSHAASLDQYLNVIAAILAKVEESKEETCLQPRSATF